MTIVSFQDEQSNVYDGVGRVASNDDNVFTQSGEQQQQISRYRSTSVELPAIRSSFDPSASFGEFIVCSCVVDVEID